MPTISSIQSEPKSEKLTTAQGQRGDESLAFAKMLAATVQNQAQSSLSSIAAPPQENGWGATESRFAQLSFLAQPSAQTLPSFMATRWQPPQADLAPTSSDQTAGSALTAPGVGVNPFTPVTQGLGVAASSQPQKIEATARPQWGRQATGFSAFPRPANDNGRGIHWIPTPRQSPEVIDKYVGEAQSMGIKWVTLLNDGTNRGDNDYLVDKLTKAGIEPVMRLYTDGGAALEGDVQGLVRQYGKKGVHYFQLYNEPNLRIENQGQPPDPKAYAAKWLADARKVTAAGGLPGFGSLSPTPGLAPGAAPGDMDDLRFLRESLQEVVRLGGQDVLEKSWLSVHNYGEAHLRVREYDKIVKEVLGRSLPQVGTEAGIYPGDTLSQAQATEIVADAYRYLPQREDYYFAYTYWIIANDPGQGHADGAWNHQALFRPDGQSPIVDVLKQEV